MKSREGQELDKKLDFFFLFLRKRTKVTDKKLKGQSLQKSHEYWIGRG